MLCITLFAMGDQRGSRHHRLLQESAPSTVAAVEAPKLLRHLKTDHLEAFKFHFENADAARKYSASASCTLGSTCIFLNEENDLPSCVNSIPRAPGATTNPYFNFVQIVMKRYENEIKLQRRRRM